jgi:hypothetical protein
MQSSKKTKYLVVHSKQLLKKFTVAAVAAYLHIFASHCRVMMLEVWNPIEEVMNYYRNVSDFPFNFRFLTTMNANSNGRDAENAINGWVDNIPDDGWPNWVVGVQPFELSSTQAYLSCLSGILFCGAKT